MTAVMALARCVPDSCSHAQSRGREGWSHRRISVLFCTYSDSTFELLDALGDTRAAVLCSCPPPWVVHAGRGRVGVRDGILSLAFASLCPHRGCRVDTLTRRTRGVCHGASAKCSPLLAPSVGPGLLVRTCMSLLLTSLAGLPCTSGTLCVRLRVCIAVYCMCMSVCGCVVRGQY